MQENPVCVYDFTCFTELNEHKWMEILDQHCKAWCFQEEKAPTTGNLHFQGRLSLKTKARMGPSLFSKFPQGTNFSITSKENHGNDFYVCKEDTRTRGPWKDTDERIKIPKDIKAIEKLLDWQQSMLDVIKVYNSREINIVIDTKGNNGKSTFTRYCMCYGYGQIIPFVNEFKDMMRMVCDMPISKCYFIDMPRAIKKDKLYQLYSGIEMVKTGYAYDDRYKFKQILFDPPNIVVFTNHIPDLNMLSKDRWCLWAINQHKMLVRLDLKDLDSLEGSSA